MGSTYTIISIFAGRIADTGINPEYIVSEAVDLVSTKKYQNIMGKPKRTI